MHHVPPAVPAGPQASALWCWVRLNVEMLVCFGLHPYGTCTIPGYLMCLNTVVGLSCTQVWHTMKPPTKTHTHTQKYLCACVYLCSTRQQCRQQPFNRMLPDPLFLAGLCQTTDTLLATAAVARVCCGSGTLVPTVSLPCGGIQCKL